MKEENITSVNEIRKKIAESTGKLVLYIILFVIVEAIVNNILFSIPGVYKTSVALHYCLKPVYFQLSALR
ncbi:hypothetical protein SOJ17_000687 [Metallosphaera sedula DSM 5348]|nr:hypothetical protein SOJ17_000687 [Metallosphaera sedula DSM 5348]